MKRMICLLLILCCSMLALSSSALAEGVMGQDVVDSVLRMLEVQFFYGGSTDSAEYFGFPADCVPSDIRVYELVCVGVEKGSDYAFVRYSIDGEPMENYFGLYIETYGDEVARNVDTLAFTMDHAQNGYVDFASYKNMEQGFFYFIYLTDKGIDLMAESRGVWYIDKVNDALDDYWKYNS